ncbi:hypothetical protein CDD82_438 [Ophiocordyceps australis]|uniref:NodB homology domain-containing protein n=1 Tax=Ophiocordyceps australis TaxID=1399860 RepID=A0A2C5Y6H3_9HYPO|nr:hypothetical protein CDD82_438 [Ophiocordyceps australis]
MIFPISLVALAAIVTARIPPMNTLDTFSLDNYDTIGDAASSYIVHRKTRKPFRCSFISPARLCPEGFCCNYVWDTCGKGLKYCSDHFCQVKFSTACDQFVSPKGKYTKNIPRPHNSKVPYGKLLTKCKKPGMIALTYDDGPFEHTDRLLDILKKYNVKATFFISGNNRRKGFIDDPATPWPEVLHRMHREGHQLASHAWTHRNLFKLTWEWDYDRVHDGPGMRENQIVYNEMAFRNLFGWTPTYFRAPFGACHKPCRKFLADMGYHLIGQTNTLKDQKESVRKSLERIRLSFRSRWHSRHSIIIQSSDVQWKSIEHLTPSIIRRGRELGWHFATIGECMGDPKENWYRQAAFLDDINPWTPMNASRSGVPLFSKNATSKSKPRL